MNRRTSVTLFLAGLAMLGMAAAPDPNPPSDGQAAEDDAAVIAMLDELEEKSMAEDYEFLLFLEILEEASTETPADAQEEAE